ncbi:MAG: hypothetical protein Q8R28_19270 [Dehalococcoidia bacterium]|nr:hypothetical protein [Dehalococcoidia bacterium]
MTGRETDKEVIHLATKRKDGLRQTYVTVGYKPDGQPIRRYVYGRTKKEADDKAVELRAQLQSGVQVAVKKGTVGEYLDRWLARVKAQVGTGSTQPRTYMGYEQHVRLHLKPALGHLSFGQ